MKVLRVKEKNKLEIESKLPLIEELLVLHLKINQKSQFLKKILLNKNKQVEMIFLIWHDI